VNEIGEEVHHPDQLREHLWILMDDEHWVWPIVKVNHHLEFLIGSQKIGFKSLTFKPRLFYLSNFLSSEECDYIRKRAEPHLERSQVAGHGGVNKGSQAGVNSETSEQRTSSYAWLDAYQDETIHHIRQRAGLITRMPMDLAETMQVLNYEEGQHYYAHHDFFDPQMYPSMKFVKGVNRFITIFFYLESTTEGGETIFPMANNSNQVYDLNSCGCGCGQGLSVPPKRGDAVLWYNLQAEGHMEGNLDRTSLHGACNPKAGQQKWGANYWIRNKLASDVGEAGTL